ncbi:tumor necrosis factor receptor superfamily member 14-like isoform X2 [Notamacropus eugenii]|uniref:tumor necrosis factor receptor superfamily member 14-like isoform X2 n=1 Tax=Notamacropus eugenii TaxID=9315 RepID=UPI003B67C165
MVYGGVAAVHAPASWSHRFSMFLMAQFIPFKEALKCMEGEYEVDGQCCPTCQPGFRVHETCSIMTGTMCVPCDPGTYTAHHSGLKECLQCKVCDPELGLVTRRKCSPTSNTVCGCSPGHFCVIMKDVCEMCMPHRVCTTGQYVSSRGTERSNTICEKCQTGTFSPNGTLGQCLPWTNCTTHGLFEEKPGTDTTDALCSSKSDTQRRRFGIPVIVVIILMTIILGMKLFGRKKNQQNSPVIYKSWTSDYRVILSTLLRFRGVAPWLSGKSTSIFFVPSFVS